MNDPQFLLLIGAFVVGLPVAGATIQHVQHRRERKAQIRRRLLRLRAQQRRERQWH